MQNTNRSLAQLTSLFFMWGFLTALNDVLIPTLKGMFQLTHLQANLVNFSFFGAYFLGSVAYFGISIRSGDPINRIGYKNGIVWGLLIAAVGCWLFFPAAALGSYPFFLAAMFVLGLGFTLLQIAANPFVALIGPEATAASRLNLAQAVNSFAKMIAPVLGGVLIFKIFGDGQSILPENLRGPYLIFGLAFVGLAMLFRRIELPTFQQPEMEKSLKVLGFQHFTFGVLAIFVYVGAEVSIGSNLVSFIGEPQIAGLALDQARPFVSWFEGGAMIGRFLGAISLSALIFSKKLQWMGLASAAGAGLIFLFSPIYGSDLFLFLGFLVANFAAFLLGKSLPGRTLGLFALINTGLVMLAILADGRLAMWSLIAAGLFNSIMWSNIFTLAIDGLGRYKSQGSSLLVMAILGGAILPLAVGAVADSAGLQTAFWVLVPCFLYLAWYGFSGSRQRI